jgi:hypothetical protein
MKFPEGPRFLTIYSGVLTLVFAISVLSGFAAKPSRIDELNVQRINFVEPDGTVRMIMSNQAKAPGAIFKGKEYPHPDRKAAGVLFFDEEGTECGGLMFGGRKDKDGKVSRSGHLSFDQYDQDQVFSIDAGENNGRRTSGITIVDRGDYSILGALEALSRTQNSAPAERAQELGKFFTAHTGDAQRAYFGRASDRSVGLRLMDEKGRPRLVIRVDAGGSPIIQFLDESGKATREIAATETDRK